MNKPTSANFPIVCSGAIKEVWWVDCLPDADGDGRHFKVGQKTWVDGVPQKEWPVVSRITLQNDIPGLHGNMDRICVYIGEEVYFEVPRIHIAGMAYLA